MVRHIKIFGFYTIFREKKKPWNSVRFQGQTVDKVLFLIEVLVASLKVLSIEQELNS